MLSAPAYLVGRALWGVAIAVAAWRAGRQPLAVAAAVSDVCATCLVLAFVRSEFRATLGRSYFGAVGAPAMAWWEVLAVAPPLVMGALLCFNS